MAISPKANGKSIPRETNQKTKSAPANNESAGESNNGHGSGKPDRSAYDTEQNKLRNEIEVLQTKLNAVKDKINLTSKDGPQAERRKTLRSELDELKNTQANGKNSRGRIFEQLKALNETIAKKTKELQTAKHKFPFKTLPELDAHVKRLETQIDSGTLKLIEEKRALQGVNQAKRSRKAVENFQKDQQSIDEDKAKAVELKKQLDDPESKALSDRFDAIKKELEEIREEGDKAQASRNALFTERNTLKEQLDELFAKKKQGAQTFREANDRYHLKIAEDRARRAEKRRLQKLAEEAEKAQATAERLREEAAYPAYQREIEECQLLIEHFSLMQKGGNVDIPTTPLLNQPKLANVPTLELRQVDTTPGAGLTALKKKGEDDDNYFVGGKGKKKGSRSSSTPTSPPSSTPLRLPFHIVEALMKMSIPTPSPDEIPRVLEDIKTKKTWFEANQARTTAENQAKAEREIQKLISKTAGTGIGATISNDVEASNGDGGEKLVESASTLTVDGTEPSDGVSTDIPDAQLETNVQE